MFEITFGMALDGARRMNEPASIAMAPEPTNASGAVQQVRVTPAPSAQQEFTRSKFVSMKAHSLLGLSKNAFVRQYGEFT